MMPGSDFDRKEALKHRLDEQQYSMEEQEATLLKIQEAILLKTQEAEKEIRKPDPSIAALDQIQDYRFGSMVKSEKYAFARGLTINPTHLPSALDAMEKDGWHLLAIFGQTTAKEIGFIFRRASATVAMGMDGATALSHAPTHNLERVEQLERRVKGLLHANTALVLKYREIRDQRRDTERACSKLVAHVQQMQNMAMRYLTPGSYVKRTGQISVRLEHRQAAFIDDMIYMLDGPEQREAMSGLGAADTGEGT